MIKFQSVKILVLSSLLLAFSSSFALAQSTDPSPSPSPSPTDSPSPTPDPSPSPTPSSSSNQSSTNPSPSPDSQTGGVTKEEVLGETTVLGETNTGREVAKWALGAILGLIAFLVVLKLANSAQE